MSSASTPPHPQFGSIQDDSETDVPTPSVSSPQKKYLRRGSAVSASSSEAIETPTSGMPQPPAATSSGYYSFPEPESEKPLQIISRRLSQAKKGMDSHLWFGILLMIVVLLMVVVCVLVIPFPQTRDVVIYSDDQVLVQRNGHWISTVQLNLTEGVLVYQFQSQAPVLEPTPRYLVRVLVVNVSAAHDEVVRFYLEAQSAMEMRWEFAPGAGITVSVLRGRREYDSFMAGRGYRAMATKTEDQGRLEYLTTVTEEYYITVSSVSGALVSGAVNLVIVAQTFSNVDSTWLCTSDCLLEMDHSGENYFLYVAPAGSIDSPQGREYVIHYSESGLAGKYVAVFVTLFLTFLFVIGGLVAYCWMRRSPSASEERRSLIRE